MVGALKTHTHIRMYMLIQMPLQNSNRTHSKLVVFITCTTESRVILLPAIIQQLSHLFFIQDDMANQILGDILLQLHKEERVSHCIM